MAKVVNLRRAAKARARADKSAKAATNAALHGRTKAQREAEEAAAAKARRDQDGHRLE
jgi:hypothetical protein